MCCRNSCATKCYTWHGEVWWEIHCIKHFLFPFFVYVYTVEVVVLICGANVAPWINMGWPIHAVCGFWIFKPTGYRVSNWIIFTGKLMCYMELFKETRDEQRIFMVIFACDKTCYNNFRVKLVSDLHRTNTKISLNVFILGYMLFSTINMVETICYMKPMPIDFLFIYAHDSLSNMWNFYCNPCLVIKWANFMKDYNIYVPTPVLHLLWWYIETSKILEDKYLLIDFIIKYW